MDWDAADDKVRELVTAQMDEYEFIGFQYSVDYQAVDFKIIMAKRVRGRFVARAFVVTLIEIELFNGEFDFRPMARRAADAIEREGRV